MAHTKEAAWIEGARFMRNRVQAHKGKRIEALKQNSDQATIKSKGSL